MKNVVWHILAIFTIFVWSISFVSTKVLLSHGFSPIQIFVIRFILVYAILVCMCHKKLFAQNIKDELTLAICGITGCTLYYLTENSALAHTFASNVSLIVCTNPLITMLAVSILFKSERINKRQAVGSLLTLVGMVMVVLNGKFVLNLSPVGDLLAFSAALVWTIYSIAMRRLHGKYSVLFINRKVFFYGVVTSLPLLAFNSNIPWANFAEPAVWGNFLFLGTVAGLVGYIIWTKVLEKLGTVFASNYIYTIPLGTILFSAFILNERITPIAILGAAVIITGMVLAEKKSKQR